jgi:hypothetical protein
MDADEAHEAKCLRCGRCCYYKEFVGTRLKTTGVPCEYLDIDTNLCRVYPERHSVKPTCRNTMEAIHLGALPKDCPYARGVPGYIGLMMGIEKTEEVKA